MPQYRVVNGMDYAGKRAEPGEVVSDLPAKSVAWLVAQGHVEPVSERESPKKEAE